MMNKTGNENRIFKTNLGEYQIDRFPVRKHELLQAWNAADEYVIDYLSDNDHLSLDEKILVCNDSFGALAVAFNKFHVQSWSDSYLSHQATLENYKQNKLSNDHLSIVESIDIPKHLFSLVILKVPKTLALLEYQLIELLPLINTDCRIIVAGMVKNMPKRVWKLLEKYIGDTQTSLAKKKARLICVQPNNVEKKYTNPYPIKYQLENHDFEISNHANVFSRDSLDIGTRFFLEYLPVKTGIRKIIDLGCGNGVVGLIASKYMPEAKVYFIDESYMAVDSAKINFLTAFTEGHEAVFLVNDGLNEIEKTGVDLVLCNPPFHQQQVIGDLIAKRMFEQSKSVLKKGGELWVIGNNHLAYKKILKRSFNHVKAIASNKKFTIFKAVK